ncbi:RNase H-like domain-containing protein [Bacteroides uniformis]
MNKEFVVCTDTCVEGLGGVLLQENSIIAYESIKLKKHEQNYIVYDL